MEVRSLGKEYYLGKQVSIQRSFIGACEIGVLECLRFFKDAIVVVLIKTDI